MDNEYPFHEWGDEDFDWKGLNDAMNYFYKNCKRYGRVGLNLKEKWGTMRVGTTCAFFNEWPIHSLIKPGYYYYSWPRWMMIHIDYPLGRIVEKLYIGRMIRRYQIAVVKFFWKRAAKKWPHIAAEILDEYNITFW